MAGEIAFDVVNNSLRGELYKKGKKEPFFKYRIENLKLDTANGIGWEVFNLTGNYREIISLEALNDMYKIYKEDLNEEEKGNLEKLLKQPNK